ncbi:hypothetical protein ACVCNR_11175 [Aquamicrobium terrae]
MNFWQIIAFLTPALGALAIVYALKLFPTAKASGDQYELDLGTPKDYARPRSAMAHSVDRATDRVKEEVKRIRDLPSLPRK